MAQQEAITLVREIMTEFARLTGLAPAGTAPRRYLWTDAFAVCNYLELFRQTGDGAFRDLALLLVDQVHHTLGRHRADDPRSGWISGLSEEEGERHPTIGGLRIGKEMNERQPGEPYDERLEWDRDGQYYHYLTKWMHALSRVSRATGEPRCLAWGVELARTAHARFCYTPHLGGRKLMYWKMSIDLTRPLVLSMGQHDPLDGLVTCSELQAAARGLARTAQPGLDAEIADLAAICRGRPWATDDPLGIGGLLADATRIVQLMARSKFGYGGLLEIVLDAALSGLATCATDKAFRSPAAYRLPFRELGLAIGLKGMEKVRGLLRATPGLFGRQAPLERRVEAIADYLPLGRAIEEFWLDGANRESASWREHREINMVTLATSLAPEGFLEI